MNPVALGSATIERRPKWAMCAANTVASPESRVSVASHLHIRQRSNYVGLRLNAPGMPTGVAGTQG